MEDLKKLITDLHDMKKQEDIETQFGKIASFILTRTVLNVNNILYRFTDLEFYFYQKGIHEDIYAHNHSEQLKFGKWYFHASGIDITIGNENGIYGGILIRGIVRLSKNDITDFQSFDGNSIDRPIIVKTEVCKNLNGPFDRTSNVFNLEIIHPETSINKEEYVVKTNRINLNPERDPDQNFSEKKYRFVLVPRYKNLNFINKTQIAKAMLGQLGLSPDVINDIFGYRIVN